MKKIILFSILLFLSSFIIAQQTSITEIPYGHNKKVGNFVKVNNIKMYYEIYGNGDPLVLIHGNGESIESMKYQINYGQKGKEC